MQLYQVALKGVECGEWRNYIHLVVHTNEGAEGWPIG